MPVGVLVAAIAGPIVGLALLVLTVVCVCKNKMDDAFRHAMFAFLGSVISVGWSGSSFWSQHGNEHFCIYEMLLFARALQPTGVAQETPEPEPLHEFSPFQEPLPEQSRPGFG